MNDNNTQPPVADDEIDLLELATAIGEEKTTILGITGIGAVIGLAVALLSTPIFTAKTVILPPQQQASAASAMLSQLGALSGLAGAAAGIKSPDEQYVSFLSSVRLQNVLISQFDLMTRYETDLMEDTRKALSRRVSAVIDKKSGLLTISVDDEDPAFAAELANAHIPALSDMMATLALSEAQQRRVFFEQQLEETQAALDEAEVAFREQQQRGGMVATDALAEAGVKAGVQLRAQIAQKEVQLQSLRGYATAQNPDVQRLASELGALRNQLRRVEEGGGEAQGASNAGMEAVRSFRDVKVLQAKLEVLIKQYEMARMDEAREGPLLQVVDVAVPPERKAKPKGALIVILATMLSGFVGLFYVLVRSAIQKASLNQDQPSRVSAFKRAWSFRKN